MPLFPLSLFFRLKDGFSSRPAAARFSWFCCYNSLLACLSWLSSLRECKICVWSSQSNKWPFNERQTGSFLKGKRVWISSREEKRKPSRGKQNNRLSSPQTLTFCYSVVIVSTWVIKREVKNIIILDCKANRLLSLLRIFRRGWSERRHTLERFCGICLIFTSLSLSLIASYTSSEIDESFFCFSQTSLVVRH